MLAYAQANHEGDHQAGKAEREKGCAPAETVVQIAAERHPYAHAQDAARAEDSHRGRASLQREIVREE